MFPGSYFFQFSRDFLREYSDDFNNNLTYPYIWWLIRVTLVVAFDFLPPNFGRCQGAGSFCLKMNAAWVVWTIIGGGGTQTLLAVKKLNFMHSQMVGTQKLSVWPCDRVMWGNQIQCAKDHVYPTSKTPFEFSKISVCMYCKKLHNEMTCVQSKSRG